MTLRTGSTSSLRTSSNPIPQSSMSSICSMNQAADPLSALQGQEIAIRLHHVAKAFGSGGAKDEDM